MSDPLENNLFDLPDYEHTEDETFPPLPPPLSPGREGGDDDRGEFANGDEEPGENTGSKVEVPSKKAVKRPQPKLDAQRLTSERGLPALRHLFDSVRFKGKGHETEDLKTLIQRMEHWAHRLYPKLQFEDFINRLETLGNKKEVQTCLKRIRLDLPIIHEDFTTKEGDKEEESNRLNHDAEEFDPFSGSQIVRPESTPHSSALTEEQRLKIERNKQIALEKRQAKMQQAKQTQEASLTQAAEEPNSVKLQDLEDLFDDSDVESLENEMKTADAATSEEDKKTECSMEAND